MATRHEFSSLGILATILFNILRNIASQVKSLEALKKSIVRESVFALTLT